MLFALFCFTNFIKFLCVQGFSTGLPENLQLALLRTLPGLENCSMLRPAYAVEYDFLPAYQCTRSLMTKKVEGLFFSGQINGTTGYEEAAAQVSTYHDLFCDSIYSSVSVFFSYLSVFPSKWERHVLVYFAILVTAI